MIVKGNGKGQVTRRNKQTNEYFSHYKQLNTLDYPYHIHKYLDSESSTFLPVNRYSISRVDRLRGDICPYVCPQTGLN